jgi:hypothetical protein
VRADNETVLRWFILVVALLLDPAAVLLLLAADPEAMNRSQGTKQHQRDRLVETQAERPTSVGRVGEFGVHEVRRDIRPAPKAVLWKSIGIHRHDVLEASCFRPLGAKLERLGDLPLVDAIEQMAVMDEEPGATCPLKWPPNLGPVD